MNLAMEAAERGLLPDPLIRRGIRSLLRDRLREIGSATPLEARARTERFVRKLRHSPIAVETRAANEQHYEVPTDFFREALGPNMKYSSCLYGPGTKTLAEAEEAMLALTCERAGLRDGMEILELGCGWGSLTLWMARHFPGARIHAVSNSHGQRRHILARCRELGLANVRVTTCDVNHLEPGGDYDRIVTVEMLEHVRNYDRLFERMASWLAPGGKVFVHIFCHGSAPYAFETEGDDNWMGRHFFTGGIMPSEDLFTHFNSHLVVQKTWRVAGTHYSRTAEDWLANMDRRRESVLRTFEKTYGSNKARLWFQRWRIFFMACAELWGYNRGREWYVGHYLLAPRTTP